MTEPTPQTANVIGFTPKPKTCYIKISRNGERFWLEHIRKGMGQTNLGKVANQLVADHPYGYGDFIEYLVNEVVDSLP
jgi:hypothetical protein